jgi:hypothetical protein
MKRRQFITLLGGATVAWPLAARAQQQGRVRRIGVLMNLAADDPEGQARLAALLQGLQEVGWVIGRNAQIDIRWGAGDAEQMRKQVTEMVALAPDVILATGGSVVPSLLQATRTVPIVFTQTTDPVGAGFVNSLARPGGNATGFLGFEYGISAKWLEMLKEIAPRMTRAAVIRDVAIASGTGQWGALQSVAPSFGVELSPVNMLDAGEIERAVAAFARSARCRRDRARCCCLRALPEWRPDPDGERVGDCSSRSDHHAGGATQAARRAKRTKNGAKRNGDERQKPDRAAKGIRSIGLEDECLKSLRFSSLGRVQAPSVACRPASSWRSRSE